MTGPRDPERLISEFLADGLTELPDRAYDAVRSQIEHTRQRVVIGPWKEEQVSRFAMFALAAAAVVAVVVIGIRFLPRDGGIGVQPSPTPSPSPVELPLGDLPAGTYVARPFLAPNDGVSFTFTLPDGWTTGDEGVPGRAPFGVAPTTGFEGPTGMSLGFLTVTGLEGDPCNWEATPDIEVGPTVEDLATALADHDSYDTSNPTDVSLGGFSGARIDVELPAGLDLASCDDGQFWIWTGDGQAIYAQGPEGRFHLWILDVQGSRVLVMTHDFPGTPAADQAELQSIVESIRITP